MHGQKNFKENLTACSGVPERCATLINFPVSKDAPNYCCHSAFRIRLLVLHTVDEVGFHWQRPRFQVSSRYATQRKQLTLFHIQQHDGQLLKYSLNLNWASGLQSNVLSGWRPHRIALQYTRKAYSILLHSRKCQCCLFALCHSLPPALPHDQIPRGKLFHAF